MGSYEHYKGTEVCCRAVYETLNNILHFRQQKPKL